MVPAQAIPRVLNALSHGWVRCTNDSYSGGSGSMSVYLEGWAWRAWSWCMEWVNNI